LLERAEQPLHFRGLPLAFLDFADGKGVAGVRLKVVHVLTTKHVNCGLVDGHSETVVEHLCLLSDKLRARSNGRPAIVHGVVHLNVLVNVVEFVEATELEYITRNVGGEAGLAYGVGTAGYLL